MARYRSRDYDLTETVGRGVWGSLEYINGAGASLTIRGTGVVHEEVPLVNLGYGFNLSDDSDAEMILLSLGSDVDDMVALASIPRDLQFAWPAGQGGVQHPTDPSRRLHFGEDTWLTDGTFVIGANRSHTLVVTGSDAVITTAGGQTINIGADGTINISGNATVSVGGSVSIAAGGALSISAASVDISSGSLTHNGVNVGDTHTHGGVLSGGSNTGVPE